MFINLNIYVHKHEQKIRIIIIFFLSILIVITCTLLLSLCEYPNFQYSCRLLSIRKCTQSLDNVTLTLSRESS
ncbi:hypothetical protein RIR_jg13488.t1 [Rhizophagus irregularis DAOM 181602=DAOM 197198]|nr:hypothetical protein RIR_jg13488.t1 [Rhizophagus irregularis DAOM 181602=DAOM 197198]